MGREVKRVPMDFDWPIKEIWHGYLMPEHLHSVSCPKCEGTGHNAETKKISDDFYDFSGTGRRWCDNITEDEVKALIDKGRLYDFTHTFEPGEGWKQKDPPVIPSPAEVNRWNKTTMGHDCINRWTLIETRAKRLGVYGKCDFCKGEGELWASEELKKQSESWRATDPPEGPGWQMWEDTSEGSPISPVFDKPESLARWLSNTSASAFGGMTCTYEQWLNMITSTGWAMSAVADKNGLRSGVEGLADEGGIDAV